MSKDDELNGLTGQDEYWDRLERRAANGARYLKATIIITLGTAAMLVLFLLNLKGG